MGGCVYKGKHSGQYYQYYLDNIRRQRLSEKKKEHEDEKKDENRNREQED